MNRTSNRPAASQERLNLFGHLARRFSLRQLVFAIVLTFFLVSILFPFYWMISSSFKTYAEIGGREPVYVPGALRLEAYRELFDPAHPSYQRFGVNIVNTIKVSIPTALIAVILSTLGAYAVARLRFRGRDAMLNGVLLVYLFPGILLIIPLFAMLSQIGAQVGFDVRDNLAVLMLTYLAQTLPVALYMLANYFRTIPDEIEQAGLTIPLEVVIEPQADDQNQIELDIVSADVGGLKVPGRALCLSQFAGCATLVPSCWAPATRTKACPSFAPSRKPPRAGPPTP